MLKRVICGLLVSGIVCSSHLYAAPPERKICGRYSSLSLLATDTIEVTGVGAESLSLLIKGRTGSWIFFDSLVSTPAEIASDRKIKLNNDVIALQRAHNRRIYALQSSAVTAGAKRAQVGVMGVDLMGNILSQSAISGDASDLEILRRVRPGVLGDCNLRWKAGHGLIK